MCFLIVFGAWHHFSSRFRGGEGETTLLEADYQFASSHSVQVLAAESLSLAVSCTFPMVFSLVSYQFPINFLLISYGFL